MTEPELLLDDPDIVESVASLSPEGDFIVYVAVEGWDTEEPTFNAFIRPYPDVTSGISPLSAEEGSAEVYWAADGYIYYVVPYTPFMKRVPMSLDPALELGELEIGESEFVPRRIRVGGSFGERRNFDFDAAENRLLIIQSRSNLAEAPNQDRTIVVIQNWTDWLRREVPFG